MWRSVAAMKTATLGLEAQDFDRKAEPERKGRKASKETRRQQLIEATIDLLAKRGYSETTMADVADGAGLSRGIVNFHFESKEKLLVATLQYMADEYSQHWRAALQKGGDDPARQLFTLVAADFDRSICNKRKLAAWCAFWGEAKSRPTYQALCGARDEAYQNVFIELCRVLKQRRRLRVRAARDRAGAVGDARGPVAAADDGHRRRDPGDGAAGCDRIPGVGISKALCARGDRHPGARMSQPKRGMSNEEIHNDALASSPGLPAALSASAPPSRSPRTRT